MTKTSFHQSDRQELITERHLQLWFYLLPIVGIIPSCWTLVKTTSNREQKAASRLAITLALSWLVTYLLLYLGTIQGDELLTFRLLYANALLTTSYFLICLGLVLRLSGGKSLHLPLISKFADRILGR